MLIEIICVQKLDFNTREGQHVKGTKAWYLDKEVADAHCVGTMPRSIWTATPELEQKLLTPGIYDIEVGLRGGVTNISKVE